MKKFTIIGAGIAGLTTAIALSRKGFSTEIYENTPEFNKAGSGISLAFNAMQVFKKLDIYDSVFDKANYVNVIKSRRKDFKVLTSVDLKPFEKEFQVQSVAIHRASLHQALLENLSDTPLLLDKKLKSISEIKDSIQLNFEDNTTHSANCVIGSDGIHSEVRKYLFPKSILRDSKQLCWRGICKTQNFQEYARELNEVWGTGKRFGFVRINPEEVYWFAVLIKNGVNNKNTNLLNEYEDFHPVVSELINQTIPNTILFNELWDLKPINQWHRGNICLSGDAAHATTPNMGQGAVQAIESALVLSSCLEREPNVEKAFEDFELMRMKKAHDIVNTSWSMGKIAQLNNPIACGLRNFLVSSIPTKWMEKRNREVYCIVNGEQ